MGNNRSGDHLKEALLFALLFILISTVVGFWLNVEPTALSQETPPPFLSSDWWAEFREGFESSEVWAESVIGVILGALLAISVSLLRKLPPYMLALQRILHEKVLQAISQSLNRILSTIADWIERVRAGIIEVSRTGEYLVEKVLPAIVGGLTEALLLIAAPLESFWKELEAPKWYQEKGAIDPGFIEVSLAVTAIVIALPALATGEVIELGWFRILSVALPTGVSILFIDLYAKDKGSSSLNVLLSPIGDGPFFLLSWAILMVSIFAIITFASLGG
jgi:hypothetical protein